MYIRSSDHHSQMFFVHFLRRDDFCIHHKVALTVLAPAYFRRYVLDRHVSLGYSEAPREEYRMMYQEKEMLSSSSLNSIED